MFKTKERVLHRSWTWAAAGIVLALATVLSVAFVDRPVALAAYRIFAHWPLLSIFTKAPSFYRAGLVVIPTALVLRLALGYAGRADRILLQCAASLALTRLLLAPLKITFGRTWPLFSHPSFIKDGAFEFNFFHKGQAFASFPSGHMAAVCAVIGILWISYSRYRVWYIIFVALLSFTLVFGDFHFVSDVIAGGFLGAAVATAVLCVSNWLARIRRRAENIWQHQE